MSTSFIDLSDRIVTDTGQVVAKYDLLVARALLKEPINVMATMNHPDVRIYNARNPDRRIAIWKDDGKIEGPALDSYDWTIPERFQTLDVVNHIMNVFLDHPVVDSEEKYLLRLERELTMMEQRGMFPFLRCLIFIMEVFKNNDVVWGVGRGSSCASLVLFVLGVNRVDPVLYDIPIEEFLK